MPRLDAKKCSICEKMINMLGAYAQLSLTKHAHLACYTEQVRIEAIELGKRQVYELQEATRRREAEMAESRARSAYEALPRCVVCGRKVCEFSKYQTTHTIEEMRKFGEVVEPSTGALSRRHTCHNCVEVERIAQNEARGRPRPEPKPEINREEAVRRAIAEGRSVSFPASGEEPERPKSRFELIELDEPAEETKE